MKSIHTLVKGLHKAKLSRLLIVTTFLMIVSASIVVTYQRNTASHAELSYLEHSPKGAIGGSVMPASCDSYPAHSTCQCTLGQTTTAGCAVTNGNGTMNSTCVASGDNVIWSNDQCVITSCSAGYTKVTDWNGTYCKASCTGNAVMTNVPTEMRTGCSQWCPNQSSCGLNKSEDTKTFTNIISIEKAYAAAWCLVPRYSNVPIATCVDCPAGTTPDANHTSCVAPARPSVNVNFESVYNGGGDNGNGGAGY